MLSCAGADRYVYVSLLLCAFSGGTAVRRRRRRQDERLISFIT
jgi:hypothetical protein